MLFHPWPCQTTVTEVKILVLPVPKNVDEVSGRLTLFPLNIPFSMSIHPSYFVVVYPVQGCLGIEVEH